jgi:hypothetical protein
VSAYGEWEKGRGVREEKKTEAADKKRREDRLQQYIQYSSIVVVSASESGSSGRAWSFATLLAKWMSRLSPCPVGTGHWAWTPSHAVRQGSSGEKANVLQRAEQRNRHSFG